MTCSEYQTRSDLIDSLFNTREDSENSIDRLNGPPGPLKNKAHDTAFQSHKASRSIQTLDSRTSDRSQASNTGSRNTSIKVKKIVRYIYMQREFELIIFFV